MFFKKKILFALKILFIWVSMLPVLLGMAYAISVSADSAVLYDPDTDTCYYEKNADKKRGMASTTKIMTAVVALLNSELDDVVDIKYEYTAIEGSKMYLKSGEKVTVNELLQGLLLSSGNDAAMALAGHIAGDTDSFAQLMNEQASKIGLTSTSFENPSGLDGQNHYTTAKELAKIAEYALSFPKFREIVSSKIIKTDSNRVLSNHNKLLKLYPWCNGIKTGFTKSCGRCLVSSAEKNGKTLIAVTLNAPDDWNDHINMFEYGFSLFCEEKLYSKGDVICQAYICGVGLTDVYLADDIVMNLSKQDKERLSFEIIGSRLTYLPIKQGERFGEMIVSINGNEMSRTALLFGKSIEK